MSAPRPLPCCFLASCIVLAACCAAPGQQNDADEPAAAAKQANLGERFGRLELLAGRLAELSRSTQPRRAKLLRELVARSRGRDLPGRFETIVRQLERGRYSSAVEGQGQLHAELQQLLELLLQEDRDREIESQRRRIGRYLQEVKRLIRMQRGVAARTEGGDDADQLSEDQQRVGDSTGKLGEQINKTEGSQQSKNTGGDSDGSEGDKAREGPVEQEEPGSGREGDSSSDQESGEAGDSSSQDSEGQAAEPSSGKPADDPTEAQQGGNQNGQSESEGQPSPSGQPNSGGSSEQQNSEGGANSPSSDNSPSSQSQSPAERAVEALEKAQQRMQQAQEQLEKAQQDGAVERQREAIRELEQAKAELEKILRQLREEELERLLVLLEARFRKMLDAQVEVYEETQELDEASESVPIHELEISGGRLSRSEQRIVRDADRALLLLREDGTSVAFPEAVEQARADMQTIATRLANVKFGLITQGLEEDVIAALEETLAALQQALADLRQQRARQQGPPQQGGGQPGEQPLVDRLAELRMIRALQVRVNNRTKRYGAMIAGDQTYDEDLLDALDALAEREERIFEATKDLHTGRNQ